MLTMMAAFAELQRNLIGERTAAALAHKKARKQIYGSVPFGFQRTGQQLVPIAAEQAIIREMRGWRSQGWSYRRIASTLNDRRFQRICRK